VPPYTVTVAPIAAAQIEAALLSAAAGITSTTRSLDAQEAVHVVYFRHAHRRPMKRPR